MRDGAEVVIEHDARPIAVVRPLPYASRTSQANEPLDGFANRPFAVGVNKERCDMATNGLSVEFAGVNLAGQNHVCAL